MELLKEFAEHEGLEHRPGQEQMALKVDDAINNNRILFMEGGTGNGKTFAYLIPALEHLHHHPGERVVISTATILLQDQIIKKDLPKTLDFFREKYGEEWKIGEADVIKLVGTANYLCEDSDAFDEDEEKENGRAAYARELMGEDFNAIRNIALATRKNRSAVTRRDITTKIPQDVWAEISCKGLTGCKCYEKGKQTCAYSGNTRAAKVSPLVVTNHNYLVTNVGLRTTSSDEDDNRVTTSAIIVDEAHKLPEVLARYSGRETNLTTLRNVCENFLKATEEGSLVHPKANDKISAIRERVDDILVRLAEFEQKVVQGFASRRDLAASYEDILGGTVFRSLHETILFVLTGHRSAREVNGSNKPLPDVIQEQASFLEKLCSDTKAILVAEHESVGNPKSKFFSSAMSHLTLLSRHITGFAGVAMGEIQQRLSKEDKEALKEAKKAALAEAARVGKQNGLTGDALKVLERQRVAEATREIFKNAESIVVPSVVWFEKGLRHINLMKAPLDNRKIQAVQCQSLMGIGFGQKPLRSLILVSATLSTNANAAKPDFTHFRKELGLGSPEWDKHITSISVPSAFDWANQAKLILPQDVPMPAYDKGNAFKLSDETAAYLDAIASSISESVRHVDGNSLVLCSSTYAVDRVAKYLEKENPDMLVLNQANGYAVERMLHEMRRGVQPKKILVGMQSLWQGVDLPGEALRGLFIQKIPFASPSHPLARERRANWKDLYNAEYFTDQALPEALTIFRQGVGRLIRGAGAEEYGVVVCYDPNFSLPKGKQKGYVKHALSAVPADLVNHVARVNLSDVATEVKAFFDMKQGADEDVVLQAGLSVA